jgi:3-hydroxybutyryl-CoA dehydrogenase
MQPVTKIGVVGAGVMGSGIAQVAAVSGYDVCCVDIDAEAIERAREVVRSGRYGVDGAVERGKITREQADRALDRLRFSTDLDELNAVDLVVEAVPERFDLKIRVVRDLDRRLGPDAVLASNTSGFSIAALGAATDHPDRVVGWHWASPAPVMRFAEIVRAPATSDATVALVCEVARACGKNPVVVNDAETAWGFVANRIYFAAVNEAHRVVAEGIADRESVDQLMMDCFRWPAGPFGMVTGATKGWK